MKAVDAFVERWVGQLIPHLQNEGKISEEAAGILKSWLKSTGSELQGEIERQMLQPAGEAFSKSPALQGVAEKQWSPEQVMKFLLENDQVIHAVFGAVASARGHRIQGYRGPSDKFITRFAEREIHHRALFMDSWDNYFQATFDKAPNLAKITPPVQVGDFVGVKLSFNDFTGDSREGSHTDYTVAYPVGVAEKVSPVLLAHPEVLIVLFMRLFPNMERTGGNVRLHPRWKEALERFARYNEQKAWAAIEKLSWR
ncbi:hypothetical protein C4580_05270 [Candidatus Woesearchaeota archaeon]|nr:MAG: hypothetical protein C4580_05270 [Candidatus Woesearchaeota archaeon]